MDYRDVIASLDLRTLAVPGARFSGDKPVLLKCYWHDDRHKSLAIYRDHLYCYGCQKRLSVLEWIAEREGLDIQREFKKVVDAAAGGVSPAPLQAPRSQTRKNRFVSPMSEEIARRYHARLGLKRRWYLDRQLTDETIDRQLLGYDGRAFTIPVWHPSGQLLTIRFRRDDSLGSSGPKYWGIEGRNDTLLYNQVALRDARCVVITEGELDCLRLWQEGIPVVSSTNGAGGMVSIWPRAKRRFRCERIVIAFDQDEGGQKAAQDLRAMICGKSRWSLDWQRAVALRWEPGLGKDITELAGRRGIEYVLELIREASCSKKLSAI
jgi:DNA primase